MKVRIATLHRDAVVPKYANEGDAGLDLTAISCEEDEDNCLQTFGTGLAIEIPEGYVGLIFPRSSIYKTECILSNSVGVIDSGYRGEIKAKFYTTGIDQRYKVGDKIAQLIIVPYPKIELEEVYELSDSERGTDEFGSSGS